MKKICVLFLFIAIVFCLNFFVVGCNTSSSHTKTADKTVATSTVDVDEQAEEKLEQKIKSELMYYKYVYCGVDSKKNYTMIMIGLCEELSAAKAYYYTFAKDVIDIVKKIDNKNSLGYTLLRVEFYNDESSSITWDTTNMGFTGKFTTSIGDNYNDTQNYSLKDLKKYSNQYY